MVVIKIYPKIYQIDYLTQKELGEAMLRFQEHYESPEFRGKVFNLEEYKEWYMKRTNKDEFTYYKDWSGFNFPSSNLIKFRQGLFDPLTEAEQKILKYLPEEDDFYVIGTYAGGNSGVLHHEILHGMYYTIPEYKKEINEIFAQYDSELDDLKKFIKNMGYHETVVYDEIQAYMGANYYKIEKAEVPHPKELRLKIQKVITKYMVPV